MNTAGTCNLSSKDRYSDILTDCRVAMEKLRAPEGAIQEYLDRVAGILDDIVKHLGSDVEVRYSVSTRFKKALLKIEAQGERFDPADGVVVDMGIIEDADLQPLLRQDKEAVIYGYHAGQNVIRVASPRIKNKTLLGSPLLWGAVLGLALGFLCTLLPDDIRSVIVDDVVTPVKTVALNLIFCVMGPVILISMITAVSALKSVNDLTNMGLKLIARFAKCILSVMFVGIMVSLLFFGVLGDGDVELKARDLVNLLLDIFPKDPISPIKDGNTPQLVIMGLVLGAALIIPGSQVKGLKRMVNQVGTWIMTVMDLVQVILPVIPFCSVFIAIASDSGSSLLDGWQFVVVMFLSCAICGAIKFFHVARRYKIRISALWGKLKPLVTLAFMSGNITSIMRQEYEFCENELGISHNFTSFWIPLSQAMLSPRATLNFVIPPFLIMQFIDKPISLSFLIVLVIVVLELSIADPGTAAGWTVLFASLGLSSDFVGLFLTFELVTANYNAAYGALQMGLEAIESAATFDAIDMDRVKEQAQV